MSTEVRQEVKAPVTFWDFLLRIWWVLLLLVAFVLYVLLKDQIPSSFQYGYWTFIAVFIVVYWFLGLPEGYLIDTTDIDKGKIKLELLNRYQIATVDSNTNVLVQSDEGTVVLVGDKLISVDETGQPKIHPLLELQANCEIARRVANSQQGIIDEYLVLKRSAEYIAATKFTEMYKQWRIKMRLDPEVISNLKQEPKSTG